MISIVIPVYGVEDYLRQCLNSIINQSYKDIEIIIIDDGSPDGCGQICDEYGKLDDRIIVCHTENHGVSAARNLGISLSSGKYIGFVDPDDWIEPDMYKALLNGIEDANADVCMMGFVNDEGDNSSHIMPEKSVCDRSTSLVALLEGRINSFVWNKLFRKELFNKVLFPVGKQYEDVYIMHRVLSESETIAIIPDCLYHYRIRKDSISRKYSASNLIEYAHAYLERYNYYMDEVFSDLLLTSDDIQLFAVNGISRVWRWWYGCSIEEKIQYDFVIDQLYSFTRAHLPMLGSKSWPIEMRFMCVFMHSKSTLSFFSLYEINQLIGCLRKFKNVIKF